MSETSTITKPKPAPAESKPKTTLLNTTHRCDNGSCDAQAWVKATLRKSENLPQGGHLLFCAHHYHKVEAGIAPFVLSLLDERHRLVSNRLKGSENS